jgi:hypothetical protein
VRVARPTESGFRRLLPAVAHFNVGNRWWAQ